MKTFLFTYYFDGSQWELPIEAETVGEAKRRFNSICFARYTGERMVSVGVGGREFVDRLIRRFGKKGKDMTYSVLEDSLHPFESRVEAIDHESEGECYVTIFSGPRCGERAREYAAWKNASKGVEG